MSLVERHRARTGAASPSLSDLVAAHTATIPFENLDPLAGRPVHLDPERLARKLLDEGRGGYCFEQNGLLMRVLRELGHRVEGLAARVRWGLPADAVPPRTHMVLRVDGELLVDVGFGGQTPTAPLRFAPDEVQATPHEPFRLREADGRWTLESRVLEEWLPLYEFDLTPQEPVDFELASFWTSSHPTSRFRAGLVASRVARDRRHVLRNLDLAEHFPDGRTERRRLATLDELRRVLVDVFGIRLPADGRVDAALGRVARPSELLRDGPVAVDLEQLGELFRAVGFRRPTDPDTLHGVVFGAYAVVSAWDEGRLVGFARALSDGVQNALVSTVAVAPSHQRRGIGRAMVERLLAERPQVKFVLHSSEAGLGLYRSLGFEDSPRMLVRPRRA